MGFPRQEYWSGFPCPPSRDLPDPGIKLTSPGGSCTVGRFFTSEPLEKAHMGTQVVLKPMASLVCCSPPGGVTWSMVYTISHGSPSEGAARLHQSLLTIDTTCPGILLCSASPAHASITLRVMGASLTFQTCTQILS